MRFGNSHSTFLVCTVVVRKFTLSSHKPRKVSGTMLFAIPLSQVSGTTQRTGPTHIHNRQAQGHRKTCVSPGDTLKFLRRIKRCSSSFDVTSATIVTGDTEKHMPLTLLLAKLYIAFTLLCKSMLTVGMAEFTVRLNPLKIRLKSYL